MPSTIVRSAVAVAAVACMSGVALADAPGSASMADSALSDLLKRQTQEFSDAGQRGDGAAMGKYLDPDVVFMNETGQIVTKADIVGDGSPPPAPVKGVEKSIQVTEWAVKGQGGGQTATATFVDVLTQRFHGQTIVYRFRSTETWARRADSWKMISSQTMNVIQDPAAVTLPTADLDSYVGTYQVDPEYKVEIKRAGDGLTASANGSPPVALKAELRDVLFIPGAPNGRRIFQRDTAGRVTGYISRRDGTDIVLTKVG